MNKKYIDKIYDGRWKVVQLNYYKNSRCGQYVLKNIYNDNEIVICDKTLRRIERNETTVSRVIFCHINKSKHKRRY